MDLLNVGAKKIYFVVSAVFIYGSFNNATSSLISNE
jgi:hypothetical protein